MAEYLHGAYGQVNAVGNRVPDESQSTIVYFGTAPVHNVDGGAKNVNKPILINNIAEARSILGYSDDWASYTLCEPMRVHLENKGIGPLIFVNVLDPEKHLLTASTSVSKTPASGSFTITDAENIFVDSLEIAGKTLGTHYIVSYNEETKAITVSEKTAGSLGTDALTVTYEYVVITTVTRTLNKGSVSIAGAGSIILDSVVVQTTDTPPVTKVKGTDYSISYNSEKATITIAELTGGALGTGTLSISYKTIDPSKITNDDVIGETDGLGLNTGIYTVKDVYNVTGFIPAYLAAPGFSSIPAIHQVMYENSRKISTHWDAYMFIDLPLTDNGTTLTFDTVNTFKRQNNYTRENETVYFPLASGTDGRKYHISVLAAANFQELLETYDGIPFHTASNTECTLVESLYMGEAYAGRIFDDSIINEKLNKNGIASAAYVGGRWAIWGAHSADYDQTNGTYINVAETNRMMLYYISNDFQDRRMLYVDQPLTPNDIRSIVSEEQTRIDALKNIGALTYGKVVLNASLQARADIMNGDWQFLFDVTTTPLAKSLKAIVNWTDEGFATYFEEAA